MADLDPAAERDQPLASPRSLAGPQLAAQHAQPIAVTRSLADIEAQAGTEFKLKLLLKPSTAANMGGCPFPMEQVGSEDLKSESDPKAFFITFDKQYRPEDEEELLEWFAEVVRPKPKESNSSEPKAEELKGAQPEPGERQEQVAKNEELASNGEAAKRGEPAKGIPGHRDILIFPPTLDKHQRAHWHQLADKHGLASASEGVGPDRVLTVALPENKPRDQKRGRSRSNVPRGNRSRDNVPQRGSRQQREKAKRIWDWCQAEGGSYFSYSQNEILEMITTTNVMPPDLARLIGKRDMAKRLVQRIQKGESEGALALLERERTLAWVRDDDTGGYPLHVAAWKGLESVVAKIIEQPSTLEQRDCQRKTPLQIARRRNHQAVVDLLLQAGATDSSPPPAEKSAAEKPVRMIQGPVPKHGEDHEEMRRLWNEPLPPSGSDATEEGNDSDRQESRAVGAPQAVTGVTGLKPDEATQKEMCPAQPAERLLTPALEEARAEWSGRGTPQLTTASSTEAMSDSHSETAEQRRESVMDGLRVSPRPAANKPEVATSAEMSVEQECVPMIDAASEGNKISDYESAQITSALKETTTGPTLSPANSAEKPGSKVKVADDDSQSGSKQPPVPRSLGIGLSPAKKPGSISKVPEDDSQSESKQPPLPRSLGIGLSPAKKQPVQAQGTGEDMKVDNPRSQLAEALETQQEPTAGIIGLEPKAEAHESQSPQPVNPSSASLQANTKLLTEENLVAHVERHIAAAGKERSVSEDPPAEAPVLDKLKLYQQGREIDVLQLLQQQPEVRVTVGGQNLWISRDDIAEWRSKIQGLADALQSGVAAMNALAAFCQGQLTPPASAESTEAPNAMGSLAPIITPELHALPSSSDTMAKPAH